MSRKYGVLQHRVWVLCDSTDGFFLNVHCFYTQDIQNIPRPLLNVFLVNFKQIVLAFNKVLFGVFQSSTPRPSPTTQPRPLRGVLHWVTCAFKKNTRRVTLHLKGLELSTNYVLEKDSDASILKMVAQNSCVCSKFPKHTLIICICRTNVLSFLHGTTCLCYILEINMRKKLRIFCRDDIAYYRFLKYF